MQLTHVLTVLGNSLDECARGRLDKLVAYTRANPNDKPLHTRYFAEIRALLAEEELVWEDFYFVSHCDRVR